jgi:hypothetical protein
LRNALYAATADFAGILTNSHGQAFRNAWRGKRAMRNALKLLVFGGLAATLAACGHNTEQRAATGAAVGLVVAGPIGAAVGAGAGVVVSKANGGR